MDNDIKQIGTYDAELEAFENQYPTPEGVTYNSYLIDDEKIAVIDTVDARKSAEWQKNLRKALPEGRTPDYLIVEHLEPDHTGALSWLMAQYPECRLVCTAAAGRMLPLVTGDPTLTERMMTVADGEKLSLGRHTLSFHTAPMVHWPEVMMVYDEASHTLFSADAFGSFGNPESKARDEEAARYYYNIVGKYGQPVRAVLAKLKDKEIDTIAPLHGSVISGDVRKYLDLYDKWSSYEPEEEGVLVAYASIHGMTADAADRMAEILIGAGAQKVVTVDLTRDNHSHAVREAFRMSRMVLMAPTYDGDLFPPMHHFLHHLSLKGFRNRAVGIVENGLWAPAAGRKMKAMLEGMQDIRIAEPAVTLRGRHTAQNMEQLAEMAENLMKL
ncbi:MAG: MBL fold metallo-hydrolase [Muribaculaceae bacterium]|nr:MBL fold metallo-hydrolase [Muribaculaceae bacterium]